MDFYKYYKYYKYKKKYTELKQMLGGERYCNDSFLNKAIFDVFNKSGLESIIYVKKEEQNILYKVMNIINPLVLQGKWKKNIIIHNQKGGLGGLGIMLNIFNEKCCKYKLASDLGMGPYIYDSYLCKSNKYGVIKMQKINGKTILELKKYGKYTQLLDEQYKELLSKLYENNIIENSPLNDVHDDNFIVENETNKIYGIDF